MLSCTVVSLPTGDSFSLLKTMDLEVSSSHNWPKSSLLNYPQFNDSKNIYLKDYYNCIKNNNDPYLVHYPFLHLFFKVLVCTVKWRNSIFLACRQHIIHMTPRIHLLQPRVRYRVPLVSRAPVGRAQWTTVKLDIRKVSLADPPDHAEDVDQYLWGCHALTFTVNLNSWKDG